MIKIFASLLILDLLAPPRALAQLHWGVSLSPVYARDVGGGSFLDSDGVGVITAATVRTSPHFAFRLEVGYERFTWDRTIVEGYQFYEPIPPAGSTQREYYAWGVVQTLASIRLARDVGVLRPYLIVGAGQCIVRERHRLETLDSSGSVLLDYRNFNAARTSAPLGANVGLGLDVRLGPGPFLVGAVARWNWLFKSSEYVLPIVDSFLTLGATLSVER